MTIGRQRLAPAGALCATHTVAPVWGLWLEAEMIEGEEQKRFWKKSSVYRGISGKLRGILEE